MNGEEVVNSGIVCLYMKYVGFKKVTATTALFEISQVRYNSL